MTAPIVWVDGHLTYPDGSAVTSTFDRGSTVELVVQNPEDFTSIGWALRRVPDGSTAALSAATGTSVTLGPLDVASRYALRCIGYDGNGVALGSTTVYLFARTANYALRYLADDEDVRTNSAEFRTELAAIVAAIDAIVVDVVPDAGVSTAKLVDGSVTTAKLAAGAITNAKIADNAIAAVKLAAVDTSQVDWYVNSATGNDTTGTGAAGAPLQTLDELSRRLRGARFRTNMTVHLSGSFADQDLVVTWTAIEGCSVAVVGTPTQILAGTFTAVQNIGVSGAQDCTVTDSAIPVSWTASGAVDAAANAGSYLIRKMVNGATAASAFTAADLGSKTCAVNSWVSNNDDPFDLSGLEVTVSQGDIYRVDSITRMADIIVAVPGTQVVSRFISHKGANGNKLRFPCAGTGRVAFSMSDWAGDSLVEGMSCLRWFTLCIQNGSSGLVAIAEMDGYGLLIRGPSATGATVRFFGATGVGIPGSTVGQACGLFFKNGTAIGISNVLFRDLPAGIDGIYLETNSRCDFVSVAAINAHATCVGVNCAEAGAQANTSGGIIGFTNAAKVLGVVVPNAKLGTSQSWDYAHQAGFPQANLSLGSNNNVQWAPGGSSTTVNRPTTGIVAGMPWFDTTLGKPIWRNATNTGWVDSAGTGV